MPEIHLVRKGAKALKPEHGDATPVAEGSTVTFTVEAGVTGTAIHFTDETPFDSQDVDYNRELPVKVRFNRSNPRKNHYRYKCHGIGPNGEQLDSDGGGGEMEIIQG
jgi:hypothetical protein